MKLIYRLFVFSVLIIAVVACGGNDSAEPAPEGGEAPTTEPATAMPPTPLPEAEATEPAPTEEPAVPTEEIPTEAAPTEEPAEGGIAIGGGWGESGSGPQSACDHPYFPMRTGSTWSYTDGAQTLTWMVTEVEGDLDNATALMQATIGDVTVDYRWNCSAGEGMASFDFANLGVGPSDVVLTIEQESGDGVFLLPADQLEPGASWMMTVLSTFTFTQSAGGTDVEANGNLTNEQTNTVVSVNPVTFDGQTFDGIQLEQNSSILMVFDLMGNSVEQTINTSGSFELARGLGMVNQTYTTDFGPSSLELVSYLVP